MINAKELRQQIARLDGLLQAADEEGNKQDIILFAGLMAKLQARLASGLQEDKPKPLGAWKHINAQECALEARILGRDECATIDF